MGKIAFVFPGQGSQKVGMGLDVFENVAESREIFEATNRELNENFSELIFNGDKSELTITSNTQPALLATSIALLKAFEKEVDIKADYYAGHSLGEFSAYVAAGTLKFDDAIKLVRTRGELMQAAVPAGVGTMAAVLGLDYDTVDSVCKNTTKPGAEVTLANVNCPDQVVITGTVLGVNDACEKLKEAGAKRVMPLEVSGPFHSPLMREASDKFAAYLNDLELNKATGVLYTNLTAKPDANVVESLQKQLYSPVLWHQTIENMIADGVDTFIEIGPGKVLNGLIKKINSDVKIYSVNSLDSIKEVKELLSNEITR